MQSFFALFRPLATVALLAAVVLACGAHAHTCVHDALAKGAGPTLSASQQLVRDAELEVAASPARTAAETRALGSAGIRIKFDTSLLDNDEATRVCDAAGTTFTIGTQAEPAVACGPTVSTGCTSTCTADMVFTAPKAAELEAALVLASAVIAQHVNVIAPATGIQFPSSLTACGSETFGRATVPSSYLTTATPDADLIVLVTRRPTLANVQSYGVECLTDQLGRPIAGHINIAPQYIDVATANATMFLVLHELIHVMGFSTAAFPRFVNSAGKRYSDLGLGPTSARTTSFGNVVTRFEGPRVAGVAKQFWDCAVASGVELENGGGVNVQFSHWEKRQLDNELMTAFTTFPTPVLSVFTLALLEDSGWYRGDYEVAMQSFRFGYHGGCAFFDGQCKDWNGYFCDADKSTGCVADRSSKGVCTVTEWTGIPTGYQYFGNDVLGGDSILADFCPFYTGAPALLCSNASGAVVGGSEVFGPSSKCFASTLDNSSNTYSGEALPRCYSHSCTGTAETGFVLSIAVAGSSPQACPPAGGTVSFAGFFGEVICPPAESVCAPITFTIPPAKLSAAGGLAPLGLALLALIAVVVGSAL